MLLPLQMNSSFWMTQYGDDKTVSAEGWSEKVVSRSEGTYGDVTFILGNDTHYGAVPGGYADEQEWYDKLEGMVESMNAVVGEAYPEGITGSVATPTFVIHPGDTIDDSSDAPTAIETFIRHFGSDGTDGLLNYPVYLTRGNHDNAAAGMRERIVAQHGDYKYRFSHAGIHFICLDTYAMSSPSGTNTADSFCTLTWLEEQLKLIGKNDRIILYQHYDYETAFGIWGVEPHAYKWWYVDEADALLAAIEDYNVIGILNGHHHGTTLPGDSEVYEPFRTYNTLACYTTTYWVVRITDTKFQAAHWNPWSLTPGWITPETQSNTITSRVPYGADKTISSPEYSSDKEIT